MVFSPASSTVMMATPVVPARWVTAVRSTPPASSSLSAVSREGVIADGTDHAHRGTGAAGGERLVGALAAGDERVVGAMHRLAGGGNALHARDQIDVDRAENRNHRSCLFSQAPKAAASVARIQAAFSSV